MRYLVFALTVVILGLSSCNKDPHTYAEVETDFGKMKIKLYNSTPKHRDNFIKLANEGFYDGLLFHRVINNFMIQGGDPDSRDAGPGVQLGAGGPGYQIDAEIGAPHLKGAVAAARTQNPEKRSSGCQFYVVQGQPIDDAFLDNIEIRNGIKYNVEQRKMYKEIGGAPFLDNEYTVFGEIVEGMDVIDKIGVVATDSGDRPISDITMKVRIVN